AARTARYLRRTPRGMARCRRHSAGRSTRSRVRRHAPDQHRLPFRTPDRSRRSARRRTAWRTSKRKSGATFVAPPLLCRTRACLALLFELALDRVAVALRSGAGGLALGFRLRLAWLLRLLFGLLLLVHD